jgi:hypothetical protein
VTKNSVLGAGKYQTYAGFSLNSARNVPRSREEEDRSG